MWSLILLGLGFQDLTNVVEIGLVRHVWKKKQKNSHPGVSDETVLTDPFVLSGVGSGLAHRRSG